ncbi:MAG: rRNA pseudouridine synthase [Methylobacterium brachiatum]|nr:rRNA pseudouridine synthase [Methylobacterium brachiatum]
MKAAKSVRLDKLLANLGYGSRREIQGLARAGAILLDGARRSIRCRACA